MRRNPNAQGPGPQRKRRDKLSRTTLFDDGSGGQTRRHDLASARLLVTKSRPIGFEDVVRPIAKSNGPPKSSRSSVPAERLVTRLNERAKGCAAILPMDGCHYDGCVLFERVLHARKGAPEAFHVLGLLHMLAHSSRSSPEPEGRLRVDLTRSPRRRRMAGICAQRSFQLTGPLLANGRKTAAHPSPDERPNEGGRTQKLGRRPQHGGGRRRDYGLR
jgi:hypothetical protein